MDYGTSQAYTIAGVQINLILPELKHHLVHKWTAALGGQADWYRFHDSVCALWTLAVTWANQWRYCFKMISVMELLGTVSKISKFNINGCCKLLKFHFFCISRGSVSKVHMLGGQVYKFVVSSFFRKRIEIYTKIITASWLFTEIFFNNKKGAVSWIYVLQSSWHCILEQLPFTRMDTCKTVTEMLKKLLIVHC